MNERIRELAGQATRIEEPDGLFPREVFDQEKFAELIVQECADLCESFGESGDGYTCSAEILEHFGVEE
jgi:hypothetical protein